MRKNKYLLLLFFIFLALSIVNFPWGKWFLGWDNLVPEFNFSANIQRAVFSLWQENEGLGLIGGHGYAATVLHSLTLFVASIVVPIKYLRPLFTLTMLLIGSLGSFFLTRNLLETKEEKIRNRISFIAGLFYMLNFATVQMFYIPLEAFCVHFASLPWLLYSLIRLFKNPIRKNFLIFTAISLLSSPQGFIPPLFLIYALFLFIFSIVIIIKKRTVATAKLIGIVAAVTLFTNAYWLLPVGFYSLARSQIYLNSYNNQTTTDDFVYKSKKYGSLNNVVTLKGLIYDAVDSKGAENIFYIFQPWKDHLDNRFTTGIFYFIFFVILFGVYESFKKEDIYKKIFAILLLFSFTFLSTDVFPFSYVSDILRNNIPVLKQAFRIGFTKFSISLALFYSIFLAFGLHVLIIRINKFNKKYLSAIIYVGILLVIFYLSFPSFRGYFFYNRIKLKFPEDNLNVFNFFSSQDMNTRIADFPQAVPTGWSIYSWDYTGSGFWWYGLNQPIMDRNFDVWNNYNENYYWELSQAIYSNNINLLSSIIRKYQIKWLLIDRSLVGFVPQKATYIDKLEQMFANIPEIQLVKAFGKITIYKVSLDSTPKNFVFLAKDLPVVGPGYKWGNYDKAYEEYGDYVSLPENRKNSLSFRSVTQSRISNDSNGQGKNRQTQIEKTQIIDVDIHDFLLTNNKLINQKKTDAVNPHTSIIKLDLSSRAGITTEANATWPISEQISDSRLSWDLVDKSFIDNDNSIESKSLSKDRGFNQVFAADGAYLPTLGFDVYYPFRSLFTGRQQDELEFGVDNTADYFSLKTKIPKELVGYKLEVPALEPKEVTELDASDLNKQTIKTPQIYLDGELIDTSSFWGALATPESDSGHPPAIASEALRAGARMIGGVIDLPYIKDGNLEVRIPKISGYYSSDIKPVALNLEPRTCDNFNKGSYKHDFVTDTVIGEDLLRLTSVGSSNCLDFDLPVLSQDIGYLVTVENRNIEGKSLLFAVINENSQRADIETYLPARHSGDSERSVEDSRIDSGHPPAIASEALRAGARMTTSYFIIPPMEQFGLGYTLHLDNISIGRVKTVNDLGKITVNPIPYRFLTGMKILKGNPLLLQGVPLQNVQVDHPNPSLYQITLRPAKRDSGQASSNTTLVLSQSYDDGWKAYEMKLETRNSKLENFLIQLFPFWFGNEIKDHVLVNNWENGWQIGNLSLVDSRLQDNSATKDQRPTTIIIIYLPQYLEYGGFILLGGLILYLLLTKRRTQLT